jgi:hypothetical protein
MRSILVCAGALAACLGGCSKPLRLEAPGPAAPGASDLVALDSTLRPLRAGFDAAAGRPRLLAILSPTCGPCVFGAIAVREAVLEAFPDAGVAVLVVWIDMLGSDDLDAARRAARIFDDARVAQFHDPDRHAGSAAARWVTRDGSPAWDVYLFYGPDAVWSDGPPEPRRFAHQLGRPVADPARLRTGEALASELHAAMVEMGFGAATGAPGRVELEAAWEEFLRGALREEAAPCAACAKLLGARQCSLAGWRRVVARKASEQAGGGLRLELSGDSGGAASPARHACDGGIVYDIDGMSCPECPAAVAASCLLVEGVELVEVDAESRRAVLCLDPAAAPPPGTLELDRFTLRRVGAPLRRGGPSTVRRAFPRRTRHHVGRRGPCRPGHTPRRQPELGAGDQRARPGRRAVGQKQQDLAILIDTSGLRAGCPADLDGDGHIRIVDLLTLLAHWG